ncbi:MAG: 4-hydroxy-tetrahydrodipicolinate synthase [Verrucomicrobiota bacterium]
MFEGVHTALVTPFREDRLDEEAFCALIHRQFEGGVRGVVPVGTTGESPTLTHDEHLHVIEMTIREAKGKGLVIAGTGSNSTREAISMTQAAEQAGADASLQVCPYYNKPSQEGLYQHYKAIADATSLPLILYSIPGRCNVEIDVDTVVRLIDSCSNIKALKEAGGTPERVSLLRDATPDSFEILSGDDSMTLPFLSVGAVGLISVASNLIPQVMTDLVKAGRQGDMVAAAKLHRQFYPLFRAFLKMETNPVPIKASLALAGYITDEIRLPLVALDGDKREELSTTLSELSILPAS